MTNHRANEEESQSESVKETFARKLLSRWFAYAAIVGVLIAVNMIYGAICEGKCETLCEKEGFLISAWNGETGVWARLFAAMNAKHGTCECYNQRVGTTMFYNGPAKIIRLTFN